MTDILENGWKEVNENTKNIVQDQVWILINYLFILHFFKNSYLFNLFKPHLSEAVV